MPAQKWAVTQPVMAPADRDPLKVMAVCHVQDDGREMQLPPQERVAAVRPFWETLTQEQRVQLLSIDLDDLQARAKDVAARQRKQDGMWRVRARDASWSSATLIMPAVSPQSQCLPGQLCAPHGLGHFSLVWTVVPGLLPFRQPVLLMLHMQHLLCTHVTRFCSRAPACLFWQSCNLANLQPLTPGLLRHPRAAAEAAEAAEAEGVEPGEIPRLNLEPTVEDALREGLARLRQRDTWKLWRWPLSEAVFYTPDEYKCVRAPTCLGST